MISPLVWELWDSFNAIGIVLQLIGFIILLDRLTNFTNRLVSGYIRNNIVNLSTVRNVLDVIKDISRVLDALKVKFGKQLQNKTEKVGEVINAVEKKAQDVLIESWLRSREWIGIATVIAGTLFQLAGLFIEKAEI